MCGLEDDSNFLPISVCNLSSEARSVFRTIQIFQVASSQIPDHAQTCKSVKSCQYLKQEENCAGCLRSHLSIKVLNGRVVLLHEVAGHKLNSERGLADAARPEHHHLELLHCSEPPGLGCQSMFPPPQHLISSYRYRSTAVKINHSLHECFLNTKESLSHHNPSRPAQHPPKCSLVKDSERAQRDRLLRAGRRSSGAWRPPVHHCNQIGKPHKSCFCNIF